MARFLSQAWVDEFNAALADQPLGEPGGVASLATEDGHVGVVQLVHDVPDPSGESGTTHTVATLLRLDGGVARLTLVEAAPADVTVSLAYEDAAAMSRGELDPAAALGSGRISVRGDLSALVAVQVLLRGAAGRLAGLTAGTSY